MFLTLLGVDPNSPMSYNSKHKKITVSQWSKMNTRQNIFTICIITCLSMFSWFLRGLFGLRISWKILIILSSKNFNDIFHTTYQIGNILLCFWSSCYLGTYPFFFLFTFCLFYFQRGMKEKKKRKTRSGGRGKGKEQINVKKS